MARMNIQRRRFLIFTRSVSAEVKSPGCAWQSLATFCSVASRAQTSSACSSSALIDTGRPSTLVPREFEKLGVEVSYKIDEVLPRADVVNLLRIQHETSAERIFPGLGEYIRLFGLTKERAKLLKPDCLIMHPGPINRGVRTAMRTARPLVTGQNDGFAIRRRPSLSISTPR